MSIDFEKGLQEFQEDKNPAKAGLARLLIQASETWRNLYGEIEPSARVPQDSKSEISNGILTFTNKEREVLVNDGAVIYLPTGETIRGQKSAGRPFRYIADGYEVDGKNRLTEFPSRAVEVAIYPDPAKFFVPDSFSKTTGQQAALIKQDARLLRKRLGLPGIGEILPEASEATEVLFEHFNATGVRLLGQGHVINGCWSFIRTSTPTNREGSCVAGVGDWYAGGGLVVGVWNRSDADVNIGSARWVVPIGTR